MKLISGVGSASKMCRAIFCLLAFVLIVQGVPRYKLCVYPDKYYRCESLSRGNSQVQCAQVQDSVECAMKIQKGLIDFGSFHPEQVHLISRFVNEETAIVGEVRIQEEETRKNSFQTVVVVKNGDVQNIKDLYRKKYCHPGFQYDALWTRRVREELETAIVSQVSCTGTDNRTIAEQKIAQLSKYFEAACRPGPWVPDEDLDKQLKKKYSNLCALCDDTEECSYNSNRVNENALECLTAKGANVAYTSLQAALRLANNTNYKLLCKNGELQDVRANISSKCSWRNQPWPLIIAQRGKTKSIQDDLKSWIDPALFAVTHGASPFAAKDEWINTLVDILRTAETSRFHIFSDTTTMSTYLEQNDQQLDTSASDSCKMQWCVMSDDEKNKCEWVSTAASNTGIQPQISCVQGRNVFDCLSKIQNKEADVISIDSNYGYLARKKHIHNLLYNEKTPEDVSSIYIVLSQSSSVSKFSDLKRKKACFPEYRGLAWLSFIESARRHKIIRNNCDYGKSIAGLFSEVCAPGAEDAYHYNTTKTDPKTLCSICKDKYTNAGTCVTNENNKYFASNGSLQCLIDNVADVAIVEKRDIDTDKVDISNFKILCENGDVVSFTEADENCALSTTVDSEIIARINDGKNQDFRLALLDMDTSFVQAAKNVKTMELFKKFDDKEDLMFKSTVIGFDDGRSENNYVQNYIKLFEHVDQCTDAAVSNYASFLLLIVCIMIAINSIDAD